MEQKNLALIFKALSNDKRLELFQMLYEWQGLNECVDLSTVECDGMDRCFTKACCSLGLCRSTVSHHFKELENAGLVTLTRQGQSSICRINVEAVEAIRNFLK
ncbi:MAG TPA: ArsR family transcriptional regulator [Bacillota bacterium]|nr:ArsR family transcriptional regulator [Bacillota bacterium]